MTIGEKIKGVREQKGLTQKALGELCGVSDTVIRHYEKSLRIPKISTLNKISKGLGVSPIDLLNDTTYKEYFNKQYPGIIGNSIELIGFIDYLQALGYTVSEVENNGVNTIELMKDSETSIFIYDNFNKLQEDFKHIVIDKVSMQQNR